MAFRVRLFKARQVPVPLTERHKVKVPVHPCQGINVEVRNIRFDHPRSSENVTRNVIYHDSLSYFSPALSRANSPFSNNKKRTLVPTRDWQKNTNETKLYCIYFAKVQSTFSAVNSVRCRTCSARHVLYPTFDLGSDFFVFSARPCNL